jgi:hypothetical protein
MNSKLIHDLVAVAKRTVQGLLATVQHQTMTGRSAYGKPEYDDPVARKALIVNRERRRRLADGTELVSRTQIIIPESVVVKPTDVFTMPDGSRLPIVDVQATLDSDGQPYAVEVWFGEKRD